MAERSIRLIPAACGLGAPDGRCADGPAALMARGLVARLARGGNVVHRATPIAPNDQRDANVLAKVADVCDRLAATTRSCIADHELPLALIGDHSCAVGTWSGISSALAHRGPIGLVWIDAHLDSHTFETTPSGALHGMPLAALLGFGTPRLTQCSGDRPKLLPEHVCVIGVRSFEAGEAALLARLGVRVIDSVEISRRGIEAVTADALAIARRARAGFGVTLDLDAIDPNDAPGVGTPVDAGIRADALLAMLARLGAERELIGIELAEFNPHLDVNDRTAALAINALAALVSRQKLRRAA